MCQPPVVVAAAVILRDDAFLLTRRLKGTHLEGAWEFPGGKCEPEETLEQCLAREILEELGAGIAIGERLLVTRHAYAERSVELHFFEGTLDREPVPQIAQQMRRVARRDLARMELPEADAELIRLLTRGGTT